MSNSAIFLIVFGILLFEYLRKVSPKKRIKTIATLLIIYGCFKFFYPSDTFRYKLTLVVDDNGKRVESSAVREVHIQVVPRLTPEMTNSVSVRGEAVAVDLGEKGVLFSLLRSRSSVDYGHRIIFDNFPVEGASTAKGIKYYTNLKAKKELSPYALPMLVRFRDINDPKTVELVDPNDLEKSFGAGVKLVSATLEMTDERVTSGVEKWLPWLEKLKGGYLDGGFTSRNAPLGLYGGNFKAGE